MTPTVLITGGTGLVGSNLTRHLLKRNYKVICLTRNKHLQSDEERLVYSYWNVKKEIIDLSHLAEADYIIHLAGAGVMDKNWSEEYKQEIIHSRTETAEFLIRQLRNHPHKIKSFVSASAIGYYGSDAPDLLIRREGFIESDLPDDHFLGNVCVQWEAAVDGAKALDIRVVKLRTGIVLAEDGGALKEFRKPLKIGLAVVFGDGKQIVSWIHIEDLCRMYVEAIENNFVDGPYNAVAPEPVTQKTLIFSLAEKMRGKFYSSFFLPPFLLKLFLGKRSIELLKSATVSSKKIRATGFTFLYPSLDAALSQLEKTKK